MIKFILLSLLTLVKSEQSIDCNIEYSENDQAILFIIPKFDIWAFIIFTPIGIICSISIIVTFIMFPKVRKMPGEIILCISISECILSIHWFISAVFDLSMGRGPIDSSYFCQINSMFSLMAGTGDLIYNVAFCLYIRVALTNVLKINNKIKIFFHVASLAICIIVPASAKLSNNNGLNLCGTCSVIESRSFPYEGGLVLLAYTALAIYTIIFFNKTIPNNQESLIDKKKFIRFYMFYIIASCIIWTTLAVSQIMISLNCFYIHHSSLNIFITFSNLSKLASPIVLSIIRFQDPTLKKKIIRLFRKKPTQKSNLFINYSLKGFSEDDNWLTQLATNLKYTYVNTVLYGIRLSSKIQNQNEYLVNSKDEEEEISQLNESSLSFLVSNFGSNFGSNFQNEPEFGKHFGMETKQKLEKESALQFLNNEFGLDEKELLNTSMLNIQANEEQNLVSMKVKIYSPKFFQLLQQKDSQMIDLYSSLDPSDNYEQIKKFKGPDGGKSGEFFFFTNDNRLIIKTLSDQELKAFRQRIHFYAYHLLSNEDSLISIIYGLYTFDRSDVNIIGYPKTHVLIMRNISQIERQYIIRTFDMKGSEFDREALKKHNMPNLTKITLKDVDFFKLEKKIIINPEMAQKVKNILINDANFFKMVRLMDYSLLVMKIDWKKYAIEHRIQDISLVRRNHLNIEQLQNRFSKDIYRIPSIQEDGIYYHIAIIDYLQEWTAQKRAEQKSKKIMHANYKLDTSAQNPQIYANRFIEKLVSQIL